jgi:uncharacterized membrane-anchored protein
MTRRAMVLAGLVVALGGPLGLVLHKEWVRRHGAQVFLRLAPVDPRSLMQGDYMRLSYVVANDAQSAWSEATPDDARLVLALDERRVGSFVRFDDGRPLQVGEVLIRCRVRAGFARLGAESYFFQEGQGERYARAAYGELRVTGAGEALLVGLRDARLGAIEEWSESRAP